MTTHSEVLGEVVAHIEKDDEGQFYVAWSVEGRIDAMIEGEALYIIGMQPPDDGNITLYTTPPIAEGGEAVAEPWSHELATLAVKMDRLRHLSTGTARYTYERAVTVLESLAEIERNREQDHGR